MFFTPLPPIRWRASFGAGRRLDRPPGRLYGGGCLDAPIPVAPAISGKSARRLALRARHLPFMVRRNYTHEMRSAATYPLAAALAEGAFTGIVATKYFHAGPTLLAVITAAPMFGNIIALFWAELARSRRMVPLVNWLQLGVLSSIAAVALTRPLPVEIGGWVFAALIVMARVMASGIVTVRSTIWRYNYPRQLRGKIVGRISAIATATLAAATFFGSIWLDRRPDAYVYLYPAAAAVGAVGIWQFSRIRVRHERSLLRREVQQVYTLRPENVAETDEANVLNFVPRAAVTVRRFLIDSTRVLREDRRFAHYQWWQFLNGASFMLMTPPLVFMVSREMTDPRGQYLLATIVLQLVPMVVSVLTVGFWSPIFDRSHILAFRGYQSVVSIAAHATMWIGAVVNQLWVVAAAQAMVGVSNSAGNLAWNLGHNDFARKEDATAYMGVHVMLTGLRGFIAPFIGAWLFAGGIAGRNVFAVSTAMALAAGIGFWWMAWRRGRPG